MIDGLPFAISHLPKDYIIIAPDKDEAEIYELLDGKYHLKQTGKNIVHEFFFPECTARIDFKEIW